MRSRERYQVGSDPGDRLTLPHIEAVCRPIDTSVDYDCGLGCAIADPKSSGERSLQPRLPLSSATSWATRSLSSFGSRFVDAGK